MSQCVNATQLIPETNTRARHVEFAISVIVEDVVAVGAVPPRDASSVPHSLVAEVSGHMLRVLVSLRASSAHVAAWCGSAAVPQSAARHVGLGISIRIAEAVVALVARCDRSWVEASASAPVRLYGEASRADSVLRVSAWLRRDSAAVPEAARRDVALHIAVAVDNVERASRTGRHASCVVSAVSSPVTLHVVSGAARGGSASDAELAPARVGDHHADEGRVDALLPVAIVVRDVVRARAPYASDAASEVSAAASPVGGDALSLTERLVGGGPHRPQSSRGHVSLLVTVVESDGVPRVRARARRCGDASSVPSATALVVALDTVAHGHPPAYLVARTLR